jgi:hypothetical protein
MRRTHRPQSHAPGTRPQAEQAAYLSIGESVMAMSPKKGPGRTALTCAQRAVAAEQATYLSIGGRHVDSPAAWNKFMSLTCSPPSRWP